MLKKLDESQRESIQNYLKSGIEISVTDDDTVIIRQVRLINGYILSNRELHQRARAIFPEERIKPVVYSLDISTITIDWIANKMRVLGLNKKDLIKQLAIKKEDLNLYFSEKKQIDNTLKAAFYYYFLTYELNKELRSK